MTAAELSKLIGMDATLATSVSGGKGGSVLVIKVKILDARDVYGRTDLLITPNDGEGEAWVSAERVRVKA